MNSKGRIIEFYKIGENSVIIAEIRPVQCLIDSNDNQVKSTKWMNIDHWLELENVINKVLVEYEERQTSYNASKHVSEEPVLLCGSLIKIGYSFKKNTNSNCSYLVPRHDSSWPDDKDSSFLQDKGGRYKSLGRCGYRLVIAVAPLGSILPYNENVEESLYTALDINIKKNSPLISSYFQKSSKLSRNKNHTKTVVDLAPDKNERNRDKSDCSNTILNYSIFDTTDSNSLINTETNEYPNSFPGSNCSSQHFSRFSKRLKGKHVLKEDASTYKFNSLVLNDINYTECCNSDNDLFSDGSNNNYRNVRVNSQNEILTQLDEVNYVNCNSQNSFDMNKYSPDPFIKEDSTILINSFDTKAKNDENFIIDESDSDILSHIIKIKRSNKVGKGKKLKTKFRSSVTRSKFQTDKETIFNSSNFSPYSKSLRSGNYSSFDNSQLSTQSNNLKFEFKSKKCSTKGKTLRNKDITEDNNPSQKRRRKKHSRRPDQPTLQQYWEDTPSTNLKLRKRKLYLSQQSIISDSLISSEVNLSSNLGDSLEDSFADKTLPMTPSKIKEMEFIKIVIAYFQALTKDDVKQHYNKHLPYFKKLKSGKKKNKRSQLYYSMRRNDIHPEIYIMFIDYNILEIILSDWSGYFPELNSDAVNFFYLVILPDFIHKIFKQIPAVKNHEQFNEDELETILYTIAIEKKNFNL